MRKFNVFALIKVKWVDRKCYSLPVYRPSCWLALSPSVNMFDTTKFPYFSHSSNQTILFFTDKLIAVLMSDGIFICYEVRFLHVTVK